MSRSVCVSQVVRGLRDSLGESCLFLSGGGMLGMYHLGTVRRLLEEGVLPKQLCGTSAPWTPLNLL